MQSDKNEQSNVTLFRTDTSSRLGPSEKPAPKPEKYSVELVNSGEGTLRLKGSFGDPATDKIAKRLCEHMSLTHNLCCQLEHIADNLPDQVDKQECLYVARSIIPVVKHAHEFEENVLFPALRNASKDAPGLEKTLERLQGEHWEDESYASEIHNSLISFVSGLSECNIESLGYMLRGFFEGMRRHLAFEREHILPMLGAIALAGEAGA